MKEFEENFKPVTGKLPENRIDLFIELIKEASTNLPPDVVKAMVAQKEKEKPGSQAERAFSIIIENIKMAYEKKTPICQDTGTVIFHIHYPVGESSLKLKKDLTEAVQSATKKGYLRPNSVDSITGENPGDNTGIGLPSFYFDEWESDKLTIQIMLKGGGCENVGTQYALPHTGLNAGRDVPGIKKVILDAVVEAQGKGCAPGILGVGIGGDRVSGARLAKEQLFRQLSDENPDPVLKEIEDELLEESNKLGIGPMGFGGLTTLLGIKAAKMHRIPASFYVSISYMCWATRRKKLEIKGNEFIIE
ncbi:MAG: fumarate hydratase [Leptospirales bacterium]